MQFTLPALKLKVAIKAVTPLLKIGQEAGSLFKNHVCFLADDSGVFLISTNGQTKYQYNLTEGATVTEQGKAAVVYDKLVTTLEALKPEDTVTVEFKDKQLHLKAGKKESQLKTIPHTNFSAINKVDASEIKFAFDSNIVLRRVIQTMCRDPNIRKMYGVFCEIVNKNITFKAATPTCATKVSAEIECSDDINTKFVMAEFLADEVGERPLKSLYITPTFIVVHFEEFSIQTPTLESVNNFVNVDGVFPKEAVGKEVSFNTKELHEAVRFVRSTTDKHDIKVKFVVNPEHVNISSYAETARAKDQIKCTAQETFNFTTNGEVFLKFLNAVMEDDLKLTVAPKFVSYNKDNYQFVTASFNVE